MVSDRVRALAFIASLLAATAPAYAKKPHVSSKSTIDPSCPIGQDGRPDKACATAAPELTKVNCPKSYVELECDYYRQGYDAALEDNSVMSGTERGMWKNDTGDSSPYKAGYEAGWQKAQQRAHSRERKESSF